MVLSLALFLNVMAVVPFAYAATCSISSNTTVNQTYITNNNCSTINISGTTTITWSGTTDLVGAGDVNITSGTVTFSGAVVLGSTDTMSISSGATVTHAAADTTGVNITASSLTITGSINANGKGSPGGLNKGADGSGSGGGKQTLAHNSGGGGGGYGGAGGNGSGTSAGGSSGLAGSTYGSNTNPTALGSGGGTGDDTLVAANDFSGGAGGGLVALTISSTLTISGTVSVNGEDGHAFTNVGGGGGGSGGSVNINTVTINGAGTITANGGAGGGPTKGGGGGGGRIAVTYVNGTYNIAGSSTASGGSGNASGSSGTIYPLQYTVASTPSISSPTSGAYHVSKNPSVTASAYSSNGASHVSSDWKVSTDSGGNTIVWSKTADTGNLTNTTVNTTNGTFAGAQSGQTSLASYTRYYVFVRYNNSAGSSSWSSAISFFTTNTDATSTQTWNFDDASPATSFTYNSTYVEVNASSNGYARLKDQGGTTFAPSPPTTLAAWTRRKIITVTNNVASTLTDFQTKVVVTYDSDMQADFDDIRFTNTSGTAIPYWLESKTDSSTATFWVKVPSIASSSTATVYMYYGNSGASSAVDGANTFTFYDGFDGSTLDTTKWAVTNSGVGSSTVSGGLLTVNSTSGDLYNNSDTAYFLTSVSSFGSQYVAETLLNSKTTEAYGRSFGVRSSSGTTAKFYNMLNDINNSHHTTTWRDSVGGGAGYLGEGTGIVNPGNTNKKAKFIVNGNTVTGYYDDTQVGTRTVSGWGLTNVQLMDVAATGSNVYDWVFVRQYAATDPSTSFGSEVSMSSGSQIQVAVASGGTHPGYVNLETLTETRSATSGQGSTFYQISKDGTNWKYYTGGTWQAVSSDATDRNTISEVQTYLPQFTTDIGTGDFYFKVLMVSVGTQPVEIDSIALTYQAAIVNLSASTQTVAENVGTVTVTATLNVALGVDLLVPYTVSGTATGGGTDHNLANGNITITGGQTSGSTSFSVTADAIDETDETVIVTLGTPSGASLGSTTVQTITITDDDTAAISVGSISGHTTEAGGTATFTVVLGSQPTGSVSIGLSSNDTTEGTVSPSSLSFTTGNWNTPQTVTVTGVNDDLDDGDIVYSIVTATATSSDTNYNFDPSDVSVTNDDNDTSGFTVSSISGNVAETGTTATYTVVLTAQPTANVTVGVSSSDTTEGTVSASSLTFTNGNWSTPQTITVTGVDDFLDDGDIGFSIINAAASSADTNYNGLNPADVSLSCIDNDTSGFTVGSISGHTTEAGGIATFTVVLTAQPSASVSIGISSNDTTEGTVSPSSLSFSTVNWSTPQTVTVTGVDDFLDDGDISYSIVTAAASSADSIYNGINPSDVSVITDDNDTSGFTVGSISGHTTEAGGIATFTVVLNAQPTASVSVGISSNDTTEGTVSTSSLSFSTVNWSTPQTVTVTGVDDFLDDGDISYSIVTAAASSADSIYNGINPSDVSVITDDNDTSGFTVGSISGHTTEAGGIATFTVVLNAQPSASVSIGISSNDTTEGTVSPSSLSFSTVNWSTPQTVTVTGVDDFLDDGDISYSIVTAAASSADSIYNGINPSDVSVITDDNDTSGFTVSAISGNVTEAGGTATYTVVLTAQPTADVSVGVSSNDTTEGTVSASSLTFTSGNWSTPQTITVTGVNDDVDDGDIGFSIINAAASSVDSNYNNLNPADVSVTCTDNDTAGITVGTISGDVSELGTTATFTVVLNTQPTADVSVGVSSNDTTEGTVSASSLTFTSGNWSTPQTITVTGVDDSLDDGDISYSIVTAAASSVDGVYNGINAGDVAVSTMDDDTAGITLSATTLSGTEGAVLTYTIVLATEPTEDVVVAVTSDAQVSASPTDVTFTNLDWSTPQTVTVALTEDTAVEGTHTGTVTHAVTSLDLNYDAFVLSSVTVTITDNDVVASTSSGGVGFVAGGGGGSKPTHHEVKSGGSSDSSGSDGAGGGAENAGAFVAPDHWSEGYMKNLIQEQYIVQVAAQEVTFFDILTTMFTKPNDGMDRAQTLEFLLVLSGVDVGTVSVDTSRPAFTDVDPTYDRAAYVEFAYQAGLVTGYPDGSFRPEKVVNRAEALKMVTTFFGYDVDRSLTGNALLASYGLSENPFYDMDLNSWYAPYVLFMYSHGVVKGYGDGSFGPANQVTYAELLKIATLSQNIEKAVELASELE